MRDRRKYQDYTHLIPNIHRIERAKAPKRTISKDTALILIAVGCAAVIYAIILWDLCMNEIK